MIATVHTRTARLYIQVSHIHYNTLYFIYSVLCECANKATAPHFWLEYYLCAKTICAWRCTTLHTQTYTCIHSVNICQSNSRVDGYRCVCVCVALLSPPAPPFTSLSQNRTFFSANSTSAIILLHLFAFAIHTHNDFKQ